MIIHEQTVPSENAEQEARSITDGLHTLNYIPDDSGRVSTDQQDGWQPVNEVNHQAWQEIDRHIDQASRKIASGRASCLYHYMAANQMSPRLLASYARLPLWKVYLHLLPFFFRRLSRDDLRPYAQLFQISEDDLQAGRLLPAVYHRGRHD
ncbi:hypothetical protein G3480_10460 [Thiorhodococcus mannitoliphagus]|uniref:Uncharacterized protein n=1 Tax=Thiorhodococcus mannitoliphagus TaxID=329406 RepID=A0A6P1DVL0_9GAMM|nr:hypothetical protein [Thiorhodococcus mannitoliphagus]NEX20726.1 hypothetical protein [Thiorhodococcus mannitoliphagus]